MFRHAWQQVLAKGKRPDYAASRNRDWEYLRVLAKSSMLDVGLYEEFRGKGSLASKWEAPYNYCFEVVNRNEKTYQRDIPATWMVHPATTRYLSDLDYYSAEWKGRYHTSSILLI